ncbi:MAG: nucleotidyltransferase family protein [Saprospiraceae bacterium]
MIGLKEIETILKENRNHFFNGYPITEMAIFGSVARNEATEESDIDIMVEFSAPIGFEIVDLVEELEDLLQHKVDLVSKKAIRPRLLQYISKDLIYV